MRAVSDRKPLGVKITSAQVIPAGFLLLILIGTILLMLPFATAEGETTSPLTALFTSATSVCVTGLVVTDTFSHWSLFGKIVILFLIQLGGLGIIAVTSLIALMLQKRFSLRERVLIMDAFDLNSLTGLVKFLMKVVKGTLAMELTGTAFYMIRFVPEFGPVKGLWISFFTAVSAFCNAGIDIIGSQSLIPYQNDPLVLTVTMCLIVTGGLGFVVWFDLVAGVYRFKNKHYGPVTIWKRLGEHTRLVIVLTLSLIISGAVFVFLLEYNNPETIGNMSLGNKILNSLFQSVTFRTAGFAAVPQKGLSESTAFLGCLYMFIGGSPIGTAGGVKTVTMFVLVLNTMTYIKHKDSTTIFNRNVNSNLIRKASAIVSVNLFFTVAFTVLLLATNKGIMLTDAIYETASAVATVGLSRDLTPSLNSIGRVIIIVAMYLGRIGPISIAMFFAGNKTTGRECRPAEGKYYVG
ncbi:trk system potassium uptake protein TrkH [Ruminococcaceae bacterium YRB3002]|nr:trk system potassium uptake protein TrkH [Ruminococcaceae bacterium YRB3002]